MRLVTCGVSQPLPATLNDTVRPSTLRSVKERLP
jgi:hypothetical protein